MPEQRRFPTQLRVTVDCKHSRKRTWRQAWQVTVSLPSRNSRLDDSRVILAARNGGGGDLVTAYANASQKVRLDGE